MDPCEDRVGTWFNLAKEYGSQQQQGWELGAERENSRLLHRPSPWGGRLVRLEVQNVRVVNGPEDPSYLLVRPEVRSLFTSIDSLHCEMCSSWVNTFSPGDALIKQGNTMPLLRLAALLFGDMSVLQSFDGYNTCKVVGRQRLRRDFPEAGDCTYLFEDTFGNAQEYLLTMRRQKRDLFSAVCTFSTPLDQFHDWFSPFFPLLLEEVHRVLQRYLNRPGIQEIRLADANFYIILSLRNFNRGPPMIPQSRAHEKTVIINGGDGRWPYWMPFPATKRFSLAEYLRRFFEELGLLDVATYDVLDGRKLVPYQCVMSRRQWMSLRENFLCALKFQKMAYRFRHGGTTAPSLVEDVAPRVVAEQQPLAHPQVQNPIAKVVVRNTFLELEDDVPCSKLIENLEGAPNMCLKRSKSACGDILNSHIQYYSLM